MIAVAILTMIAGNYIPFEIVLIALTALLLLGILYYRLKYLPGKGVERFEEL